MELVCKLSEESKVSGEDWDSLMWHNNKLFSGSYANGVVSVWSGDLQLITTFKAHDYPIFHMASAGENATFFTSSSDCTINQWEELSDGNVPQFRLVRTLEGHVEPPRKLRILNGRLYSGDELGNVMAWQIDNGALLGNIETSEEIWDMVLFPENNLLTVRHIDVTWFQMKQNNIGNVTASVKSSMPGRAPLILNGETLYFVDRSENVIKICKLAEGKIVGEFRGHETIINVIAVSGNILVSGSSEKYIIAWNLQKEKDTGEKISVDGYVNVLENCPNGRVYAAGENKFIFCFKPKN